MWVWMRERDGMNGWMDGMVRWVVAVLHECVARYRSLHRRGALAERAITQQ